MISIDTAPRIWDYDEYDMWQLAGSTALSDHGMDASNLTPDNCDKLHKVTTLEERIALNALAHLAVPEVELLPTDYAKAG